MAELALFEGKVANRVASKRKCNICAQCFAQQLQHRRHHEVQWRGTATSY